MDPNNLVVASIIASVVSLIGAGSALFVAMSKLKPEKKKLGAEADSEIADAADSIAGGAKITTELLLGQIKRMEDREVIREAKYTALQERFNVLETNFLKWKDYAYRLSHQVQSLGHEPVPFDPPIRPTLPS